MEAWKPTMVVAFDFGMTCTAVAWSAAPDWGPPSCIQRWPGGQHGSALMDKVATQVSYDDPGRLISFGFQCDWDTIPTTIKKEFKLYLDPNFPDTYAGRPTHEEAAKYYCDYMASLRQFTESRFQDTIPHWRQRNVEYVFSIPTTWLSPHISNQLKSWLEAAGFADGYNRRINISQTEAEAAAVYAAKQSYVVGDKIIVVDAGGATTDINILEIIEQRRDRARLKALDKAEGIDAGSTLIDASVRRLVKDRLKLMQLQLSDDEIEWIAEDMMKLNNFEGTKCSYDGTQSQMDYHLRVKSELLPPHIQSQRHRITITARELQQIFDAQIQLMFETLNAKLLDFTSHHPHESVKYLVLSGGLGSSPYVQRRMRAQYPNITVLLAPEPQLAVVKGLVMDRVQQLTVGTGVYSGKCSRLSYGVLIRQEYDEIAHRGEKVVEDPIDKLKWAEKQIDWLVKEGEPISDTGFTRGYRLKIPKGAEDECYKADFVMSELPADSLPKSLQGNEGEISKVCTIRAHFSEEDFDDRSGRESKSWDPSTFRLQKRNWFRGRRGIDHYVAEFHVRVLVGTTDLRFELEGKDGRKFAQNDARVEVEWHEVVVQPKIESKRNQRSMYPATRSKDATKLATREKRWDR